jgi:hypothetical protein
MVSNVSLAHLIRPLIRVLEAWVCILKRGQPDFQ